jgi:hypothetical protein
MSDGPYKVVQYGVFFEVIGPHFDIGAACEAQAKQIAELLNAQHTQIERLREALGRVMLAAAMDSGPIHGMARAALEDTK